MPGTQGSASRTSIATSSYQRSRQKRKQFKFCGLAYLFGLSSSNNSRTFKTRCNPPPYPSSFFLSFLGTQLNHWTKRVVSAWIITQSHSISWLTFKPDVWIFEFFLRNFNQPIEVFQSHFSIHLKFESFWWFKFLSVFQFLIPTFLPIFLCHDNLEIWIKFAMLFNPLIDISTIYLNVWIISSQISINVLMFRNPYLNHFHISIGFLIPISINFSSFDSYVPSSLTHTPHFPHDSGPLYGHAAIAR